MQFDRIQLMEHLAVDCPLSLQQFCDAMQQRFGLPAFEFDFENMTEWGLVEHDGVEYNVSRPYERGTLHEWDKSVPEGCNFGVGVIISKDCPHSRDPGWSSAVLVSLVGKGLADLFGRTVYHHRTWVGVGKNVEQTGVFRPSSIP